MLRAVFFFVLGLMVAGGSAAAGLMDGIEDQVQGWIGYSRQHEAVAQPGRLTMRLDNRDAGQCPVAYEVRNDTGQVLRLGIHGVDGGLIALPPGQLLRPDRTSGCALIRVDLDAPIQPLRN